MIRAIVWKELREQGLIAITLMVLGAGILVAASVLADPPNPSAAPTDVLRYLGLGKLATMLLAVTAGMVCGGALFAAEREAGTLGFLESLPATRGRLWVAKLVAGVTLALTQISGIVLVAAGLGLVQTVDSGLSVTIYSLLAFAWGGFGSTLARTTLGSVGFAIPIATLASIVFLMPVMLVFARPGAGGPSLVGGLIFLTLMLITPLALSGFVFTRSDRDRAADDTAHPEWSGGRASIPLSSRRLRLGFRALAWLSVRQLIVPFFVSSGFALVFGLTLLLPTVQPFLVWPSLGLAAGVIAGVTMFNDEQGNRSAQFWSERRLPTGRLWAVKVAAHGLFALWLAFVLLCPSIIRAVGEQGVNVGRSQRFLSAVMRTLLFEELAWQGWKYVLVPVAYGFVSGHLCGLIFRKAVVAAGVAGLVGGTATGLWVPSMMAGGLSHWQVWLPALAALALARVLIRSWAADRLTTRGPITTLAIGLTLVALIFASAIGYRIVEIPNNTNGEDDVAYAEALPGFDANEAGRNFRTAADRLVRFSTAVGPEFERASTPTQPRIEERLIRAVHDLGWPTAEPDAELEKWMDALYTDRPSGPGDVAWFALAEESAGRPVGMYEDPRNFSITSGTTPFENARRMALVLLGRGLHLQARHGDHAAFLAQFRTVLVLVRNLRNRSMIAAAHTAIGIERTAMFAAYHWLRNLPGELGPDKRADAARLLELLLTLNHEPDPHTPFDPTPHLLAERYVIRTLMAAPNQWLPDWITLPGQAKDAVDAESDLVSFAWTVPWERERTRRLVGLVFDPHYGSGSYGMVRGRPGAGLLVVRGVAANDLIDSDRALRVMRRATTLSVALRLYQITEGQLPARLDLLVERGCLPALPLDPFDDQPFRYRLSLGEVLQQPGRAVINQANPPTRVEPGQAIIWSVGPDKNDGGGRQLPVFPGNNPRQDDWVFVVPLPKP